VLDVPGEFRPDFVVAAGKIAKAIGAREGGIQPVVQSVDGGGTGHVVAVADGAERSGLRAAAPMEHRRRLVMDNVDGAAGRAAAKQRRTRAFQDFDPSHAVERMREAAELVAVGEAVGMDLGVESADQEVVEIAEPASTAAIAASLIFDGVAQPDAAPFGEPLARNTL